MSPLPVRRLHRLLGLVLCLPLVLWMATGLLFHVKHRYAEAYEPLAAPLPAPAAWGGAVMSPAAVTARGHLDAGAPIALGTHPRGLVCYFGKKGGEGAAVDSASGEPVPLATEEAALLWAEAAVAASKHAARYGRPEGGRPAEKAAFPSRLTGTSDPAFRFRFSGGKRVLVDRVTGEVSQSGDLNEWIDATYRVHYLQWTPWKGVNVALVLLAIPVTFLLAAGGLFLALRPSRS